MMGTERIEHFSINVSMWKVDRSDDITKAMNWLIDAEGYTGFRIHDNILQFKIAESIIGRLQADPLPSHQGDQSSWSLNDLHSPRLFVNDYKRGMVEVFPGQTILFYPGSNLIRITGDLEIDILRGHKERCDV